jgi:hypothetical protein
LLTQACDEAAATLAEIVFAMIKPHHKVRTEPAQLAGRLLRDAEPLGQFVTRAPS